MRHFMAGILVVPFMAIAIVHADESLHQPVNLRNLESNESRFYLAGIMGSSFATLTSPGLPSATEPLFTSGGAAGVAFEMWDRAWRLEVEGRARDPIAGAVPLADGTATSTLSATGGWSTMVNLWRDYDLTDWFSCYVGGGIGGGGYRFGVSQEFPVQGTTLVGLGTVGGFAWQAGGGVAYALTERITLDLGYRFFEVTGGSTTATLAQSGVPISTTNISSAFSASELFFAIRIHEPFRGWR